MIEFFETPEQRTYRQERELRDRLATDGYQTDLEWRREKEFIRCRYQAQVAVLTALKHGDMSRDQAVTVLHKTGGWAYKPDHWEWWLIRQGIR